MQTAFPQSGMHRGGGIRRIKNMVNSACFMTPKFLVDMGKQLHLQGQWPAIKSCHSRRGCILIVVRLHMAISFLLEMKIGCLLSTLQISFYLLNFEFPFIITETLPLLIIRKTIPISLYSFLFC